MKTKPVIITGVLVFLTVIGFIIYIANLNGVDSNQVTISYQTSRESALQEKTYKTEAVIAGIGDILIHDRVYEDAKTETGYDFTPMLSSVKTMLQKPDLLIANQESIPGGEKIGISTYPRFNSPYEIIDAIMGAGVDMVTCANNHSLDKGEAGILSAIDYYEQKGLTYTGIFKSPEDKEKIRIVTKNGIKFAILSYAEHFNGLPIPKEKPYLVSNLDKERVLSDIQKAKSEADVIVLALHWGDEYVRTPNDKQRSLAQEFIENGADIIFGHHPHVLQQMEIFNKEGGGSGLVIYSLGNFLAGQKGDYKDIGGMAQISVEKELIQGERRVNLKEIRFYPTFTASEGTKNYHVYPLDVAHEKGLTSETSKRINQFMQIP